MAFKFQLGTARMSGSLIQDGGLEVRDDDDARKFAVDRDTGDTTVEGLLVAAGGAITGSAALALNGVTTLTAHDNLDIGAYGLRAQNLTADALTATRVVFAGADGLLSDDSDLTFSGQTLTATKLGAFEAAGSINFANQAMTLVDINSGAIDDTPIGATGHTTGKFTTCDATTDFTVGATVITDGVLTDASGFVLDSGVDIALSADGGNVTMDDGQGVTAFDFNVDEPAMKIMDDANVLDYCSVAVAVNGATTISTVDADAALANLIITADGTVDIDSAALCDITLDSGAGILLEPAAGSNILLDGTIAIDAGVVTGATSITSTAFVGTLSTAAQPNVTSVGTLTSITSTGNSALGDAASDTHTFVGHVTASTGLNLLDDAKLSWGTGTDSTLEYDEDGSDAMRWVLPTNGLDISGSVKLGVAGTDSVMFNAEINSHFVPDANSTYNLGSSAKRWGTIYVDAIVGADVAFDTEAVAGGGAIAAATDYAVITSTGTVTLPTAVAGKRLYIKLGNATANVIIAPAALDAFPEVTGSLKLESTGSAVTLVAYDDTNCYIN